MAQGAIKSKKATAPAKPYVTPHHHHPPSPLHYPTHAPHRSQRKQTGARVIKPKKASLLKANKTNKKHTSGMTAMTEKSLAGKAGHLEMLRGGKKDRKDKVLKEMGKK